MKIILGADLAGLYEPAVRLVERLNFPDVSAHWVHSVESVLPDGGFAALSSAHPMGEIMSEREKAGVALLESAKTRFTGSTSEIMYGDPVGCLVDAAEDQNADLISVGSERKGFFGSLFFGSVTKGLLNGSATNLLIGKGEVATSGPLRTVFATDHSEYSIQCVDALLALGPSGIGSIHIVSAIIDHLPASIGDPIHQGPNLAEAVDAWENVVKENNFRMVRKLEPLAPEVTSSVRRGHANEVIRAAMIDQNADLLILGAQGHGFLERLRIGSVSFHQVVSESYPVFVLRAKR